MASDAEREERVYILDYLPGGHAEDRVSDDPIAQGVGVDHFTLLELVPEEAADITIGEIVDVGDGNDGIERVKSRVGHGDLTGGASNELEYAVEAIIEEDEERFVEFFNEAGSVTIRMHQLDLLPGVGEKIRNSILDERKYDPFESLDDIEERISGFHDPAGVLAERILDEIHDRDVKYKIFVRD